MSETVLSEVHKEKRTERKKEERKKPVITEHVGGIGLTHSTATPGRWEANMHTATETSPEEIPFMTVEQKNEWR